MTNYGKKHSQEIQRVKRILKNTAIHYRGCLEGITACGRSYEYLVSRSTNQIDAVTCKNCLKSHYVPRNEQ